MDGFGNTVSTATSPSIGFHEYASDVYVDSDSDQMPDEWEVFYSLDPMSAADAAFDLDSDGRSSLEEFALSGNPFDPADSGYAVSYSIRSVDGAVVVDQLLPQSDRLNKHGLKIGAYASTNLVNWEPVGSITTGIDWYFFNTDAHRITNELIINQDWPAVFFKINVE